MATPDSTTYAVYRIVCFTTGMCYVGQTNNLTRRKIDHYKDLRRNAHTNSKLQRAYNKYAECSFYFEQLESGVSFADISTREIYWISHFNSYKNGYNLTEGGELGNHLGKPCEWNGISYPSITTAANTLGITTATMWGRLTNGYKSDEDLRPYYPQRSVTWNGIEYPSLALAAKACGINHSGLIRRFKKGKTTDAEVKPQQIKCTWNGIEYKSIAAAARANGISAGSMWDRINNGYICDADMDNRIRTPHNIKAITWNGIKYDSMTSVASAIGVCIATVH